MQVEILSNNDCLTVKFSSLIIFSIAQFYVYVSSFLLIPLTHTLYDSITSFLFSQLVIPSDPVPMLVHNVVFSSLAYPTSNIFVACVVFPSLTLPFVSSLSSVFISLPPLPFLSAFSFVPPFWKLPPRCMFSI